MAQYGFYFDSSKCTGCKTCQVACKETHRLPLDNLYRRVYNYVGGGWTQNTNGTYIPQDIFSYHVSIACNHCADPACVANCPTNAMAKDPETGIVTSDQDVCIGCKTCVGVCPYGAPSLDQEAGYVIKCDMCWPELTIGRKPVCVAACPMRALDWGPIEDLRSTYGEGNAAIEPLPQDTTSPCVVLNPHPKAQATGEGTGRITNLDEEL